MTPEQLVQRQEVVDVVVSYAHALDGRDWEWLERLFTPDVTFDYGMDFGIRQGRQELVDTCRGALTHLTASQHLMGNHLVTLTDDGADAATYFQAQHHKEGTPGGDNFIIAGRYDDHLVHGPDGWQIAYKKLTVVWVDGNEAVTQQ